MVSAPMGSTRVPGVMAFSNMYKTTSGSSHTGRVFGIQATAVKPPAAAAARPVSMVSL